jgi:hypothetical protein
MFRKFKIWKFKNSVLKILWLFTAFAMQIRYKTPGPVLAWNTVYMSVQHLTCLLAY